MCVLCTPPPGVGAFTSPGGGADTWGDGWGGEVGGGAGDGAWTAPCAFFSMDISSAEEFSPE